MSEVRGWRTDIVALAIVRRGDSVLMVREQRGSDPQLTYWLLPGGLVERGEVVSEGLVREVREEAGLQVLEIGSLACIQHTVDANKGLQVLAFVYELLLWSGELQPDDPDGDILEVAFVPVAEAAERLGRLPLNAVSRCIADYLRGIYPAGMTWMCKQLASGEWQLTSVPNIPRFGLGRHMA